MFKWWTCYVWRWGIKIGPVTLTLYRWRRTPIVEAHLMNRWWVSVPDWRKL